MIYFIQPTDGGPIKIGTAEDVGRRVGQLEKWYKRPMALLRVMPGGRDEERRIHMEFDHLRLGRTEQFRPARELLDFIDRPLLVGANPDAVELIPGSPIVRLTDEAWRWARIASSYTGENIVDYVSRIVIERAKQDADRLHAQMSPPKKPKGGGD